MDAPLTELHTDCTRTEFEASIQKTLDYIVAGDIFQANITRRLYGALPDSCDRFALYRRLRHMNPAPFSGFLQWDDSAILSSSPERFIRLSASGDMETRPIKGTRRRSKDPIEEERIIAELTASIKDRAENIMIVDLMRNDLSRVAEPFTVKTPTICAVETYETVHHLVSTVLGKLKPGLDAIDVLKATFPGGSITGAPKVRAMEIIAELEYATRGPYCGSLGFIGFDGAMDTSIMIRTLVVCDGEISFHVGGGIVADSVPAEEFEETVTKGAALRRTLIGG
jgi:para-aminobenzoate synthetase component 1